MEEEKQKEMFLEEEGEEHFHDSDEKYHFNEVLNSFLDYEKISLFQLENVKRNVGLLKPEQLKLIPNIYSNMHEINSCIQFNSEFLVEMVKPHLSNEIKDSDTIKTNPGNYDKILSTLKQFVRDWSSEGKEERKICYDLILNTLLKYFKPNLNVKVLTPGDKNN
jgi:carnosine N-methyltransferase